MNVVKKPLHVGISVQNMEESLKWYEENLGFTLAADDGFVPPLGARICFIQNGEFQLELFEYQQPKPLPEDRWLPNSDLQTIGTKHVAFEVESMAEMKERLVKNGVDIAHEVEMNGNKVMFIRDCSGVLIELIENC